MHFCHKDNECNTSASVTYNLPKTFQSRTSIVLMPVHMLVVYMRIWLVSLHDPPLTYFINDDHCLTAMMLYDREVAVSLAESNGSLRRIFD